MQKPLISIVTPSFNQGEFIEATIQSVLEQDYPRVEHIVVDGGSTDNTLSILQKYETHIKWRSEPDRGQADAINKGWQMASGEIVAWLNSDDMYTPGAISAAFRVLADHPAAGAVYGDAYLVDRAGNKMDLYQSPKAGARWLRWFGSLPQPTFFIRASVLKKVGFLDTGLHYAMDHDLFLRIADVAHLVYLPRTQAIMRLYVGTKTSQNVLSNWREKLAVVKRYQKLWFLSWFWVGYLRYRLWSFLPASLQHSIRSIRRSRTDKVYLDAVSRK